MSEYQYYEFQAVDRPLSAADRKELRALSSRADITARSFTNHYDWGDFRGSTDQLMDRWFDLHVYFANWGSRRLDIRVPARLIDLDVVTEIVGETDDLTIRRSGDNVVFSIARDELEDFEAFWGGEGDADAQWLAAMEPLRNDLLAGDLRLFYLIWLGTIEYDAESDATPEPMSGLGPLTDALSTFAEFFEIDLDLVAAAAERPAPAPMADASPEAVRQAVAALPEADRLEVLVRMAEGDPSVAQAFAQTIRAEIAAARPLVPAKEPRRTAGELRARAKVVGEARVKAEARREADRLRRKRADEAKARRVKLEAVERRVGDAWTEIENEIERRNAQGYTIAIDLLIALKERAAEQSASLAFENRLARLRDRHGRKGRFVERLDALA